MNDNKASHTSAMKSTIEIDFDKSHIWHPYTSMKAPLPCYPVQKANGSSIHLETGETLIDGMSSWWSVIHGYNHPEINAAIRAQLDDMSHVMFGGLTHKPAIDLAKNLIELAPPGLDKVFLADSGSVAVEVALKMAIQYQLGKGHRNRNRFVSLMHGYHGDTFGAMAVCDPVNSMHTLYQGILPDNYFIKEPNALYDMPFDPSELDELAELLACRGDTIAALILDPAVQGAGGIRFYHPRFVTGAKHLCSKAGVLLIADEIATGFGRTGKMFACEHANITPDIMCVGKGITGGYMSLAATMCTPDVALAISESDASVLMHGPTFMGNPLACSAANASLKLLKTGAWQQQVKSIETHLKSTLPNTLKSSRVTDARVFGAIGVIELSENVDVASIQAKFVDHGVWIRPFGKLIYIMPPYVITQQELKKLTSALLNVLELEFT